MNRNLGWLLLLAAGYALWKQRKAATATGATGATAFQNALIFQSPTALTQQVKPLDVGTFI